MRHLLHGLRAERNTKTPTLNRSTIWTKWANGQSPSDTPSGPALQSSSMRPWSEASPFFFFCVSAPPPAACSATGLRKDGTSGSAHRAPASRWAVNWTYRLYAGMRGRVTYGAAARKADCFRVEGWLGQGVAGRKAPTGSNSGSSRRSITKSTCRADEASRISVERLF